MAYPYGAFNSIPPAVSKLGIQILAPRNRGVESRAIAFGATLRGGKLGLGYFKSRINIFMSSFE
jgi:hypothetical protein